MTLVACITDTHYGAKKGSKHLHDYFELFYKNVFFPTLEEHEIKTVIHMGDVFDSRKSIDYQSLEWSKRVVFDPLKKYEVHMLVGNHDCYFKDSNHVNSPELLLQDYSNIKTYSSPTNTKIGGIDMTLIPWICSDNYDETLKVIQKSNAKIAMGHLELRGFYVNKHLVMDDHGMDSTIFSKFEKVFSGHYHTRSDNGKIFYLGNPYEMYWSDVNDTRGFHIFDTETLIHTPVNNPYKLFYNIYYDDTPYQTFDASKYSNKIVKVIVRKKSKPKSFEKFIDNLYKIGVQDLKIVENFEIKENDDFVVEEEENTISVLNRYIDESEFNFDKNVIKGIFENLYKQACEIE
jgi:DNA repair exonuclease SbcCD nuclease subunit